MNKYIVIWNIWILQPRGVVRHPTVNPRIVAGSEFAPCALNGVCAQASSRPSRKFRLAFISCSGCKIVADKAYCQ